jgi:hypothetical protein
MLAGVGLALFGRLLPRFAKPANVVPIGDGLVMVDGWILRADEAAAVLA